MNRLAAILPASNVLVDVDATSKKRAFEHAGLVFENQHAIARATVTDNLFARERLGSPPAERILPDPKAKAAAKPKHKETLADLLSGDKDGLR